MKKILCIIALCIILVSITGCNSNQTITTGDSVMQINYDEKIVNLNSLIVIRQNTKYITLISDGIKVLKVIEFDSNRKVLNTDNIQLLIIEQIDQYIGMNFKQVKQLLGEEHTDIGNGFYIPAYITSDAFLLSFLIEDNKVISVTKTDLLSNIVIERYNAE